MSHSVVSLFEPIDKRLQQFAAQRPEGSERADQIGSGASFIASQIESGKSADLIFICTHNSRRSQFAHVWASVASQAFGLDRVRSYSGGTEVTACNERTIASLQRFGFKVEVKTASTNPKYLVRFSDVAPPIECDSKLFTAPDTDEFAAMMCCSDVDDKCPIVPGAAIRIAWHYDDPKVADDTSDEENRYDERSFQIGTDMYLLMAMAKQLIDETS